LAGRFGGQGLWLASRQIRGVRVRVRVMVSIKADTGG
jgi:hypothetical protein